MSPQTTIQKELVKEFFINNPRRDIKTPEVVDWVTREYEERTGKKFRDPDRAVRTLHQQGFLIKKAKGVYRYDPDLAFKKSLAPFTAAQKAQILKKGKYSCARCGDGRREGLEVHVDHILPVDRDGKAVLENGQVLCSVHNYRKKNYGQTEMAKTLFINLHTLALKLEDTVLVNFSKEVLELYEKYDINGHIVWDRPEK